MDYISGEMNKMNGSDQILPPITLCDMSPKMHGHELTCAERLVNLKERQGGVLSQDGL